MANGHRTTKDFTPTSDLRQGIASISLTPTPPSQPSTQSTQGKGSPRRVRKRPTPRPTPEEVYHQRKQATLYCRHKLQKAFLTGPPPADVNWAQMSKLFKQLEDNEKIEAAILRETKIHKVMKGIMRAENVPADGEFGFRRRAERLWEGWRVLLEAS